MKLLVCAVLVWVSSFALATTTYTQDVKPILDANCIECHTSGNGLPDFREYPFWSDDMLGQYELVTMMLAKLKAGRMPPGNRPKLTTDEINTLQRWLDDELPL